MTGSSTIVHLFAVLDRGGAETRLLEELTARRPADRTPAEHHIVIAMAGRAGALDDDFRRLGVEIVPHRLTRRFPLWFVPFLRSRRVTHVHSHVNLASGHFLSWARLAGVPRRISHVHTVGDLTPPSPWRSIYLISARLGLAASATDIVSVSGAVRDAVFGHDRLLRHRSRVLYDRIDSHRFRVAAIEAPSDGAVVLLVVGRLGVDKNPERAVRVTARLAARHPGRDVRVRFAGRATDDWRADLERLAADLGIADRVEVLGDRDDVPALLARCSLLLSTSLLEGIPGVVLEASAAGIPAVTSAISPSEEAARYLAGVVPVPLDADDDVWCEVIEDVIAARADRLAPEAIRASFDRSPFPLTADDPQLDALWAPPG